MESVLADFPLKHIKYKDTSHLQELHKHVLNSEAEERLPSIIIIVMERARTHVHASQQQQQKADIAILLQSSGIELQVPKA